MCWNCFLKYTDTPVINERVQDMYDTLVAAAEDDTDYSMLLHVVTADMNCDDWFFDLTDPDRKTNYDEASPASRGIFDALAKLTEEERATAIAMEWGYISRAGVIRPDCRTGGA